MNSMLKAIVMLAVVLAWSPARSQSLDELVEKIRPATLYPIGTSEIKEWRRYEKSWKEIFKLR